MRRSGKVAARRMWAVPSRRCNLEHGEHDRGAEPLADRGRLAEQERAVTNPRTRAGTVVRPRLACAPPAGVNAISMLDNRPYVKPTLGTSKGARLVMVVICRFPLRCQPDPDGCRWFDRVVLSLLVRPDLLREAEHDEQGLCDRAHRVVVHAADVSEQPSARHRAKRGRYRDAGSVDAAVGRRNAWPELGVGRARADWDHDEEISLTPGRQGIVRNDDGWSVLPRFTGLVGAESHQPHIATRRASRFRRQPSCPNRPAPPPHPGCDRRPRALRARIRALARAHSAAAVQRATSLAPWQRGRADPGRLGQLEWSPCPPLALHFSARRRRPPWIGARLAMHAIFAHANSFRTHGERSDGAGP